MDFPPADFTALGAAHHKLTNPSGVEVGEVWELGSTDDGQSDRAIARLHGALYPHCHTRFEEWYEVVSGRGQLLTWCFQGGASGASALRSGGRAHIPTDTAYLVIPQGNQPLVLNITCRPPFDPDDHQPVPSGVLLPGTQDRVEEVWRRLLLQEATRRGVSATPMTPYGELENALRLVVV